MVHLRRIAVVSPLLLVVVVCVTFMAKSAVASNDAQPYSAAQQDTPVTPTPQPAEVVSASGEDVLNVLLLGSDTSNPANAGRTDAIMVVSVNRTRSSVNLLSIPRDLYVVVPGSGMQRINTAYGQGERDDYEGGGSALLKETILYNLGVPIDFYARVDFSDFQSIIDALGGIEITVDCALQDWKLISPELDPALEENWELVTIPVGVHTFSGYDALWYARSRRTSSDFDRGRRQQDLVRAIWRRAHNLGLVTQVTAFWGELARIVDTDMRLEDMLGLVPVALTLDPGRIGHFSFEAGVDVRSWRTPDGAAVQVPDPDAVDRLVRRFLLPATENRLSEATVTVEVVNAMGYANMDRVAADLLGWDGFAAFAAGIEAGAYRSRSVVVDYTGRTKGSRLETLLELLQLPDEAVVIQPLEERSVDFRVILGADFRSCRHPVMAPVATPRPEMPGQ